jgi:hypothetical protein
MLGSGEGFKVSGVVTESSHKGNSHLCRQEEIFAISFLTAAPTRIAKNVDLRGPDRQTVKPIAVAFLAQIFIVFSAKLVAITRASVCNKSGSKLAAMPIACGKTVA